MKDPDHGAKKRARKRTPIAVGEFKLRAADPKHENWPSEPRRQSRDDWYRHGALSDLDEPSDDEEIDG